MCRVWSLKTAEAIKNKWTMEEVPYMQNVICFHSPNEDNGFLSNWYLSNFSVGDNQYSSMEQYMMRQKALVFNDTDAANAILQTSDAGKIKALGRSVRNFNDVIWNGLRQIIVYQGLLEKFQQDLSLRKKLLATGNDILAECAVYDKIWGIGLSMHDKRRFDMNEWRGQNLLGFSLMCVRTALQKTT